MLVAAATAAACTGGGSPATTEAAATPESVVVQPGRPGEENATVAPEDVAPPRADDEWNRADATFISDMIVHHAQALEMSELAPDRAEDPGVLALAARIYDVQGAEIHGMAGWLQGHDLPVPVELEDGDGSGPRAPVDDAHDHDPEDMPGMLSDAQMAELEAASGTTFDRLYLEGMIQHHQGAVTMSTELAVDGINFRTQELANDIGAGQLAEIGRMQDMLDDL
ncbi:MULTISPECIES: DUF305 domain-containing protein [Isoptericola]|uniref:DUF305 domain-containing protein n=1 Tax=Isoptericola haloaureus TaxID=1542902 RepID=A0ABU7Z7G0_9MICO|nr:DUF305 domain-containing protein [Isoptericola sp. AK164]